MGSKEIIISVSPEDMKFSSMGGKNSIFWFSLVARYDCIALEKQSSSACVEGKDFEFDINRSIIDCSYCLGADVKSLKDIIERVAEIRYNGESNIDKDGNKVTSLEHFIDIFTPNSPNHHTRNETIKKFKETIGEDCKIIADSNLIGLYDFVSMASDMKKEENDK